MTGWLWLAAWGVTLAVIVWRERQEWRRLRASWAEHIKNLERGNNVQR